MAENLAESYRRRIYDKYLSTLAPGMRPEAEEDLSSLEERLEASYRPLLPQDREARILDMGCGRGRFLTWLQRAGYRNASGVDRSPEAVERARALGVRTAVCADFHGHLAAHPEGFDCIVATDVLEHFQKHEILPLLDALWAALKPGGRVIIETLNADGLTFGRIRHGDFTHETAFTRYSLHQVLAASGFEDAEFHSLDPLGKSPRRLMCRFLWRLIRLGMGLYYHIESGSGIVHNDHILTISILARARKGRR